MRLKKRAEFLNVQQTGKKIRRPAFTLFYVVQASSLSRIGFTASKKVGNAVFRNRAKRRMRALCHDILKPFFDKKTHSVDLVLIAHPNLPNYSYSHLKMDLKSVLSEMVSKLDHG